MSHADRWAHRFAAHLGVHDIAHPLFAHSARSIDPVAQLEYAAEVGFAGICDNSLKDRDPPTQSRIGLNLDRLGLEFGAFCHVPAGHAPSLWSRAGLDVEAELASSFEAADRAGARRIIVVVCDLGGDPVEQIRNATLSLGRGAELAAQRGMVLELEPVSRLRMPVALVNSARQAESIIVEVGSPGLKLIADTVHLALAGEDTAQVIRDNAETLGGIQIADLPGRFEPGSGELDFAGVLSALDTIGWTGLIEAEFAASGPGRDGEEAILRALDTLDGTDTPEKEQR
jgi:hydroxypyruvate isomerase